MALSVEEVSSSLVREYLSRKGLKRTIACMDEERPRTGASVNNRSQLRHILNIEALYCRSKTENSPFKTLLEIIVKHMIETTHEVKTLSVSSPVEINNTEDDGTSCVLRSLVEGTKSSQTTLLYPDKAESLTAHDLKGSALVAHDTQHLKFVPTEGTKRNKSSRIRRGMMPGPIASTPEESIKKKQSQKTDILHPLLKNDSCHEDVLSASNCNIKGVKSVSASEESCAAERKHLTAQAGKRVDSLLKRSNLNASELVLDDIDDEEMQSLSKISLNRSITEQSWTKGRPMDQRTATELKVVLLGSSLNCFSIEWRNQGFTFSEIHHLRYGIVQKKGGPCGVLASVQGFILKKLFFEISEPSHTFNKLRPSNATRKKSLVLAIAEILWRAGGDKQAVVAVNSGAKHFIPAGQYKSEGVLERMILFTLDNPKDLEDFLDQHIEQFESDVSGCLLLVVSVVLSRSIDKVREDMDVSSTTLIAAHGYCTQELVNLLLCGQAVSNVFDDDVKLDSGNGNIMLLKGVKNHCEVGFLSLFEHYDICKVGSYLKTPRVPVWVVCSESHFSVLFGLQRELLTSRHEDLQFDLYYYDGLSNQQEEIRLSICLGGSVLSVPEDSTELIPPLELCIRTRWNNACVNWNDTEPIL